ncbi:hypothetical protein B0H66DRAFT_641533 [Apodospora peruviana]|uniref:DUF159 domain protein n=1 Tax=Apodospora peruviana TaxID=516989 RepID=A0AAE0M2H3_9PEZI|nr:hypothetical protein B0H66DRAFT_641533 [Apodospora peruviana]
MCGRYALALSPSQVRRMLQDENMPVYDALDDEGEGAPRQSYNFAPGYHGIVYRADVPDWGAGPAQQREHHHASGSKTSPTNRGRKGGPTTDKNVVVHEVEEVPTTTDATVETHYKLQSMKWGLVPFWTKRNPDYGAVLKTINCRDDSLSQSGGMWATMKARKRCIVVAQGFYEWLKVGPKEKVPYFVKRQDGKLMCFAGLWDCVQYDDSDEKKNYTYTIITTDSNKQLRFLHDRMPVIFDPGSESCRVWLDPKRHEWSKELQGLLRPFEGELEVYPVSKEVGKVGNNSPSFIIPVASRENKGNIANFFANAKPRGDNTGGTKKKEVKKEEDDDEEGDEKMKDGKDGGLKGEVEVEVKMEDAAADDDQQHKTEIKSVQKVESEANDGGMFDDGKRRRGIKRELSSSVSPERKRVAREDASPLPPPPPPSSQTSIKGNEMGQQRPKISATNNTLAKKSPAKKKGQAVPAGSQKITKFFGNSA